MTTDIYFTVEIEEEDDGRWFGAIFRDGEYRAVVIGGSRQEVIDKATDWKVKHLSRPLAEVVEL